MKSHSYTRSIDTNFAFSRFMRSMETYFGFYGQENWVFMEREERLKFLIEKRAPSLVFKIFNVVCWEKYEHQQNVCVHMMCFFFFAKF